MIQVAGEEGITLSDFVLYQEARFLDMVYLQQDAFDEVDVAVPIKRQRDSFRKIIDLVSADYRFADRDDAREYFTRLTGLFKNLNYARQDAPEYAELLSKIDRLCQSAL
jgi:V/A-type H+-transporting ATPase subunit A